jgi:hypothetical protein
MKDKLPIAFGILRIDKSATEGEELDGRWWDNIANDCEYADELADDCGTPECPAYVVELIAREEVDRLIAAERERCAKIAAEVCRQAMRTDPQESTDYDHGWWGSSTEIERRIREVPE